MSNSAPQRDFFGTALSGLCYLNDIREITPKKGPRYLAVRVKMLQGERGGQDQSVHLRLNCNIFGDAIKSLLRPYVASKEQIRAAVSISDLTLSTYTDKEGQIKPCLYGRLFSIRKLWVGDSLVYSQEPSSVTSTPQQQAAA